MAGSSKVAVVTGATRGIGRVVTERLAASGRDAVAIGRSAEQLEELAAHRGVHPVVLDVTDADAVADAWARILRDVGVPDLLVNNAGISGDPGSTWDQRPDDWWRVFEVNVLGTFLMSRAALPSMIEAGGGRIVNVSSNAAFYELDADEDSPINSAYMASKAAVIRFTDAIAAEAARHGVIAISISPGMVKTDMTAAIFASEWDEPDVWTPPEVTADLIEHIASGELDALSGRYLHAASDDWRALGPQSADIVANDWHSLRVRTTPRDH